MTYNVFSGTLNPTQSIVTREGDTHPCPPSWVENLLILQSLHYHGALVVYYMAALCNRAGHYIFALWFFSICLLLSSIFLSSPNISGRRLNDYRTLTHGVALVRI